MLFAATFAGDKILDVKDPDIDGARLHACPLNNEPLAVLQMEVLVTRTACKRSAFTTHISERKLTSTLPCLQGTEF